MAEREIKREQEGERGMEGKKSHYVFIVLVSSYTCALWTTWEAEEQKSIISLKGLYTPFDLLEKIWGEIIIDYLNF